MSASAMANGNIAPSRFLKFDTSTVGGFVIQAAASSDKPIGISQPGVRQPPISGLDDGFAGIQNVNAIEFATVNDETWLECITAVTFGDLLESDSVGRGQTCSTDGHFYGAMALQTSTAASSLVRVRVLIGMRGA